MQKDVKSLFESLPDDGTLYCAMYGQNNDRFIDIKKSSVRYKPGDDRFVYIWGWPGMDYNVYRFADYGKTWALSMDDLK